MEAISTVKTRKNYIRIKKGAGEILRLSYGYNNI
jgi:hypothetical protein